MSEQLRQFPTLYCSLYTVLPYHTSKHFNNANSSSHNRSERLSNLTDKSSIAQQLYLRLCHADLWITLMLCTWSVMASVTNWNAMTSHVTLLYIIGTWNGPVIHTVCTDSTSAIKRDMEAQCRDCVPAGWFCHFCRFLIHVVSAAWGKHRLPSIVYTSFVRVAHFIIMNIQVQKVYPIWRLQTTSELGQFFNLHKKK